jgi:hypothetical protein
MNSNGLALMSEACNGMFQHVLFGMPGKTQHG